MSKAPLSEQKGKEMDIRTDKNSATTHYGSVDTSRDSRRSRADVKREPGAQLPPEAASKYLDMSHMYLTKEELEAESGVVMNEWVVHPLDIRYRVWWWLTIGAALVTGWLETYTLAFSEYPGLYPYDGLEAVVNYLLFSIFLIDIGISFFLAYYQDGVLITDPVVIRKTYVSWRFWWDILTTVPFDNIILAAVGLDDQHSRTGMYLALTGLLKLGRMYRVRRLFVHLEYNITLSLLWVTVVRNITLSLFTVHWAACGFYYVARQQGLSITTWVGNNPQYFDGTNSLERYLFSLYWSLVTFATLGYGDLHPYTTPEVVYTLVYVFINIVLWAYVIGSITLVVVKADEKTGAYRERMHNLDVYAAVNSLPQDLKQSLQAHVRLHFSAEDTSDTLLFQMIPQSLKKRVLRHLYLPSLRSCYLLHGCSDKFVEALLMAGTVEQVMPKVEVLLEGDQVNDLIFVLSGHVELYGSAAQAERRDEIAMAKVSMMYQLARQSKIPRQSFSLSPQSSVGGARHPSHLVRTSGLRALGRPSHLGQRLGKVTALVNDAADLTKLRDHQNHSDGGTGSGVGSSDANQGEVALSFPRASGSITPSSYGSLEDTIVWLDPGSVIGEVPFFTEGSTVQVAKTLTVTRLLVLSRSAFHFLESHYPISASRMWENLQRKIEQRVVQELGSTDLTAALIRRGSALNNDETLAALYMSLGPSEMREAASTNWRETLRLLQAAFPGVTQELSALSEDKKTALKNLIRIRMVVKKSLDKAREARITELLTATARGDVERMLATLQRGLPIDSQDYNGRTALMTACANGEKDAARLLLRMGADTKLKDHQGTTAMVYAVKNDNVDIIELLRDHKAPLDMEEIAHAEYLCVAIYQGNMPLLKRLIRAGANVNATDYDMRRPLHIAAADGYLQAIKLLVEMGGASTNVVDRYGRTPLDEARLCGAAAVVAYLERVGGSRDTSTSGASVASGDRDVSHPLAPVSRSSPDWLNPNRRESASSIEEVDAARSPWSLASMSGRQVGPPQTSLSDRFGMAESDLLRQNSVERMRAARSESYRGGVLMAGGASTATAPPRSLARHSSPVPNAHPSSSVQPQFIRHSSSPRRSLDRGLSPIIENMPVPGPPAALEEHQSQGEGGGQR